MSTRTASKKILQNFHARDSLWEVFSAQAKEMDCSIDYLINEAMRAYAEAHLFLDILDDEEHTPHNSAGMNLEDETFVDAFADEDSNSILTDSSDDELPAIDSTDDFAALIDDEDLTDFDLSKSNPSSLPPRPAETAPTIANPAMSGIKPTRPVRPSGAPPAPPRSTPTSSTRHPSAAPPLPPRPSTAAPPPPPPRKAAPPLPTPAPPPIAPKTTIPPTPPRAVRAPVGPGQQSVQMTSAPVAKRPIESQAPSRPVLTMIYQGRKIVVKKNQFIIGRGSKSADMPIKDPNVSRKHAAIIFHNGAYYIKDLGSTNGVEYGNQLVDSKRIDEGDVFTICGHPFHFTYS